MSRPIVDLDLASLERAMNALDAHTGQSVDVYKAEAAKMFNVPESEVTPDHRRYAKQRAYVHIYSRVPGR